MTSKAYALHMEKKLIDDFKEVFYNKVGYYPTIITKVKTDSGEFIPRMSLEMLADYFTPFLPTRGGFVLNLKSKSRFRPLVELRNIFCLLSRLMGYNLTQIGEFLGNRDHTTVIHNISSCKNLLETNDPFREKYLQIITHIKQNHESPIMDYVDQIQCESESALLS